MAWSGPGTRPSSHVVSKISASPGVRSLQRTSGRTFCARRRSRQVVSAMRETQWVSGAVRLVLVQAGEGLHEDLLHQVAFVVTPREVDPDDARDNRVKQLDELPARRFVARRASAAKAGQDRRSARA